MKSRDDVDRKMQISNRKEGNTIKRCIYTVTLPNNFCLCLQVNKSKLLGMLCEL